MLKSDEINICLVGVECFPLGDADFVCGLCPKGLSGDGRTCVTSSSNATKDHHSDCTKTSTNPCFDKAMCRTKSGNISCIACPKGFKGDGIKCAPVNNFEDLCNDKKNPCFPGKIYSGDLNIGHSNYGTI